MAIENTTKNPRPEWVMGGNPRAIEQQEKQGQQQLVASSQLPTDGLTPEIAAKHGIKILSTSNGDTLFTDVRLPAGWTKRATDHDMWSDLVDANGVKVAGIFYKAAFYDRRAFIRFED